MTRSTALLLSLVLATLIAANSANYYFRHPMYETSDAAAGSLAVDQAKHFAQLYGPYSRWGFSHPGPAFFYVQALGEALLFDTFKMVPAPFNGQALLCMFVEVGFFVAALQVFVQWLPSRARWWFFPLAIGLASLHFGDPNPSSPETLPPCFAFQTTWSAHIVVLLFLSLLAASASVAAGRGEELPLLVLSGGCLVHEHVAQPMFVLPCALLAYAGLIAWHVRPESGPAAPAGPVWRRALVPWERQRRPHQIAGAILAIFLLPLLVDLTRGSHSNFAAILHHVRTNHGTHKPWLKSLLYFLQFGAYSSYVFDTKDFGEYDASGMWRYVRINAPFLAAWTAAYGLAAWALLRQLLGWGGKRAGDKTSRFLAWASAYVFLATALTLVWGVIQDGEMYYYNAWFNFAIYFFVLLIAAALVTSWGVALIWRRREGRPGWLEQGVAIVATAVCLLVFGQRLKIVNHEWSRNLAMHNRIADVLAAAEAPNSVKFLTFPASTWPLATGLALQLDRAKVPFVVQSEWETMFGAAHAQNIALDSLERTHYQKWSLVPPADAKAAPYAKQKMVPLEDGVDVTVAPQVVIDLNKSGVAMLDFREGAAAADFEIAGWSYPEPWGEWTDGKRSLLIFRTAPVDADVELTVDAFPYLDPAHGLPAQTLRVLFNGEPLGPELRVARADAPPIVLTVPRAVWNRTQSNHGVNAVLELDLPDATPPSTLNPDGRPDARAIGLGVRRILVRRLSANAGAAHARPTGPAATAEKGIPSGYVFNGKPLFPSYCTAIGVDGWVGKQATISLPRMAGAEASFLRLEGVAMSRPGITYPYRFTAQVDGVSGVEAMIPVPGPFEVIVPLPKPANGTSNSTVRLDFPQTFNPAQSEPGSQDTRDLSVLLHSLAITSAAEPLFTAWRQGWYDQENDQHLSWRWTSREGQVELAVARSGTLVVKGSVKPLVPNDDLLILLDGAVRETIPLRQADWSPFRIQVPVSGGAHMLTFRSRLPGRQPPGDTRTIALGIGDLGFQLR